MDQETRDRLVEEHFGYEANDDIDGVLTTFNDGRLLGHPGRAGHVTFRLLYVFELRDGLIATEKVWPDLPAIGAQLT